MTSIARSHQGKPKNTNHKRVGRRTKKNPEKDFGRLQKPGGTRGEKNGLTFER